MAQKDKFEPSDRVILKKDRLAFEEGSTTHEPNVGIVQNYIRPIGRQKKVLVRWHKGFADFHAEDQLEIKS